MEAIFLNLVPNGIMPICHASQYDKGREIRCNLREGSTAYTIKSGDVITLKLRKPDNTIVTASITATVGNTYVVFATTEQMCAVVGKNLCELNIKNGSTEIGTANFQMDVERDPIADGDPSESEIHDLDELVIEAVGNNYYTKSATDTLLNAKANAADVYNKTETYTKTEVNNIINNLPEPMIFKGTLGSGGTITSLPAASSSNEGFTYKVITAGTYAGQSAKVGDVFVSNCSSWVLIPSGDTDSDTWRAIKVNGTEKLGNAISSGSVDFVDTTNVKFAFDSSGNKIKATLDGIYTSSEVNNLLEGKANTEGEYDGLTVGNAKQLVATVGEVDKVPYLFRTAGGAIDIGDRETDELVGGTVAFNQLTDIITGTTAGITKALTNGVIELSGTSDSGVGSVKLSNVLQHYDGHKYLCLYSVLANPNSVAFTVGVGAGQPWFNNQYAVGNYSKIYTSNYYTQFGIYDLNNTNLTGVKFRLNEFDLTAMFGVTIADYIYSLEQATAGAGVAWFKRLFNKPYYAYNAGELMSVKTSGHKLVGFNAWDEVTELGAIDTDTGLNITDNTKLRTKNYIPVIAGMAYYFSTQTSGQNYYINPVFYDADKNYIGYLRYGSYSPKSTNSAEFQNPFNIPENACFMRFTISPSYGTTYKNDVCINLSWDGERDGEYEPYEVNTYPLDSDLELRGIPKLDADNKLYYDGDTYNSDGAVKRKYGVFDCDTQTMENGTVGTASVWYVQLSDVKAPASNSDIFNGLGGRYEPIRFNAVSTRAGLVAIRDNGYLYINNGSDTTPPTGKILYELATPTDETADAFTNPQIVNDFGTEEYIDNRAVAIPVGHNTFYEVNLRAKLEMSPDSPESNGDYLMRHTSEGNAYTPYVSPIPALPSSDGNYVLKCTVSGSTKTLTWVEQT